MMDNNNKAALDNVIVLPTVSAEAIWRDEITGQLSDGMWENSRPRNHWRSWNQLTVVVERDAQPRTIARSTYFERTKYNLRVLYAIAPVGDPLRHVVRDRMVLKGRLALALARLSMPYSYEAIHAAEYMPTTYEQWASCKLSGMWNYDFVSEYMTHVSDELARMYYSLDREYGLKQMKADIDSIKEAMITHTAA